MSHHIVQAQDVWFTYPDNTKALEGISFRITHGESVAFIGENGAGKSTLLMHLTGQLMPSKGTVIVGGYIVTKNTLQNVRRSVGMVFQDSDDQLFMSTVFDDVAFGPLNMGLTEEEVQDRVKSTLETVGASHLIHRPSHRLSGGEKRSVAIATVLAMTPDILVMDEPTLNLDPKSRRRLIHLLKSFSHTKIIATHDLDMVMDLCERTIVLKGGKIIADGKTDSILRDEKLLAESNLEKPFSLSRCDVCNRIAT